SSRLWQPPRVSNVSRAAHGARRDNRQKRGSMHGVPCATKTDRQLSKTAGANPNSKEGLEPGGSDYALVFLISASSSSQREAARAAALYCSSNSLNWLR